ATPPSYLSPLSLHDALPISFLLYLRNTSVITLFTIIGTVFSASLVAYAFACLRWPGRDALFLFVVATMMLPLQVIMIPLFVLFRSEEHTSELQSRENLVCRL